MSAPPVRPPLARWLWTLCLVPLALYALAYAALTWPAVLAFSTHYFGDAGDGMQNAWNFWWIEQAMQRGVKPWFTDQLFWPDGITLLGHTLTPFNGGTALALKAFLTPVQAYNALIVFAFAATGWTCFLLAHHVTGSWLGSLFAGAVFTFSHYHFAHAVGHMNLVSLEWLPLFVLAFLRLLEAGGAWRGAAAAAALLLVTLCEWNYAFYCVLLGLALFAWEAARRRDALFWARRTHRAGLATFVVLAGASTGLLAARFLWESHKDPFGAAHAAAEAGMDLMAPFVPSEAWRFAELTRPIWSRFAVTFRSESSSYLGWVALLCAAYGFTAGRGRQRGGWGWLAIGAAFLALALGPRLRGFGRWWDGVPMPYALLESVFPPVRHSSLPLRMSVVTSLCVAVLAAHGFVPLLLRLGRWKALPVLLLALFVFETLPAPQPLTHLVPPAVVRRLAELPAGAVHGLMSDDGHKTFALFFQTVHRKPVTIGYVSREPLSRRARRAQLERLEAERRFGELAREFAVRYLVRPAADGGPDLETGFRRLWSDGSDAIWVAAGDPLAGDAKYRADLAGPRLVAERDADGAFRVRVESPLDAGRAFVVLAGASGAGPTFSAGWNLGIEVDLPATRAINGGDATEFGTPRVLDALGWAEVRVDAARVPAAPGGLDLVALVVAPPANEPARVGPVLKLRE